MSAVYAVSTPATPAAALAAAEKQLLLAEEAESQLSSAFDGEPDAAARANCAARSAAARALRDAARGPAFEAAHGAVESVLNHFYALEWTLDLPPAVPPALQSAIVSDSFHDLAEVLDYTAAPLEIFSAFRKAWRTLHGRLGGPHRHADYATALKLPTLAEAAALVVDVLNVNEAEFRAIIVMKTAQKSDEEVPDERSGQSPMSLTFAMDRLGL
ncbi:hypothetical protein C8R46DRAFT_1209392 [Mycena filopes]|nr:hypothetical protein C8R46DRAFT_1209392 [Mycena filopes]